MHKINILRAEELPFDCSISDELAHAINALIEMIEADNIGMQGAIENEIHALSRELPQGSPVERFILDYYVYGGWQEDENGTGY